MSIDHNGYLGPFLRCKPTTAAFPAEEHGEFLFRVRSECAAKVFKESHIFIPNKKLDGSFRINPHSDGGVTEFNAAEAVFTFNKEYAEQIALVNSHYGVENVEICFGLVEYFR